LELDKTGEFDIFSARRISQRQTKYAATGASRQRTTTSIQMKTAKLKKSTTAKPVKAAVAAPRKRTAAGATAKTPATMSAPSRRELTPDLIAARAYTIWEQQGRPQGREQENWLLAEKQLQQEIQSFTA
jgi:hypothetical protein